MSSRERKTFQIVFYMVISLLIYCDENNNEGMFIVLSYFSTIGLGLFTYMRKAMPLNLKTNCIQSCVRKYIQFKIRVVMSIEC